MEPDPEFTESGFVYLPLTEREYFTAPVFSNHEYFSRLTNNLLTPILTAAKQQQQQQLQQSDKDTHRRHHSRTMSGGAGGGGGGGGMGLASLSNTLSAAPALVVDNPTEVSEKLVDLHEEALEMLEKLRLDEQRRLVDLEQRCSITESHVRAKLSATRDEHCVSTVGTLNRMEAVANAALTITASVRAEMSAASSRIARGYHVLGLFEIFDACAALDADTFQNMLAELFMAREEARNAVLANWKIRDGADSRSFSAAAVHGNLFIQPPVSKQQPQQQQQSGAAAAMSSNYESTLQKLRTVEDDAIAAGFPEVLARRSRLPDAIDTISKLVPLANSVVNDGSVPEAANIVEYELWLKQQLSQEALVLMVKFTELHGQFPGSAGGDDNNSADGADNMNDTASIVSASRLGLLQSRGNFEGGASFAGGGASSVTMGPKAGSETAARHAENRRLILLNSVYAKLLLASLHFITRLHSQAHGNSHDDIVAQLQEFVIADLQRVSGSRFPVSHAPQLEGNEFTGGKTAAVSSSSGSGGGAAAADGDAADDESTNTKNMSPSRRIERNSQEVAAAFDYFIFELLWDLAMIESMFGGGGSGGNSKNSNSSTSVAAASAGSSNNSAIRAKICLEVLQRVVRDFTQQHLSRSEQRKIKLHQIIEKLSSTHARHHAPQIVAELNYHNEVLAVFLSQCRRLQKTVGEKFEDLKVPIDTSLQPIYGSGAAYAKSEGELKQLSRALQHETESHTHQFAVPPDASTPYDLNAGHEEVMKSAFDAAESSLKRASAICGPADIARVAVRLGSAFQSFVATFIERELQKAVEMLRRDSGNWASWPGKLPTAKQDAMFGKAAASLPPEALASSTLRVDGEALFCAMRLYRWGLSCAARLSRFSANFLIPILQSQYDLHHAFWFERNRLLGSVDRVGGELLTYIAGGVTARSLAVLAHLQDYKDYAPAETWSTAEVGASGTLAALHFKRFLSFTLQEAEPLLKQLGTAATIAAEERASGWDRQRLDAQLANRRRGDGLRRVLADPKPVAAKSFVLHIGCGLFRGLCSHLRAYNVNDIGVLIMKRDVALYREAVSLLFRHAQPEDAAVLDEMFDVIRELMNLLMVPLDNIRNVKVTGLLKELHHRDILEFLQMRKDIGVELAKTLKL